MLGFRLSCLNQKDIKFYISISQGFLGKGKCCVCNKQALLRKIQNSQIHKMLLLENEAIAQFKYLAEKVA